MSSVRALHTLVRASVRAVVGLIAGAASFVRLDSARDAGLAEGRFLTVEGAEPITTEAIARVSIGAAKGASTKNDAPVKKKKKKKKKKKRKLICRRSSSWDGVERLIVTLGDGRLYSSALGDFSPFAGDSSAVMISATYDRVIEGLTVASARDMALGTNLAKTCGAALYFLAIYKLTPFLFPLFSNKDMTFFAKAKKKWGKKKANANSRSRSGGDGNEEEEEAEPTGFARVAGIDAILPELLDVVLAIQHPERLRRVGARCPRGVLLNGPSGTGKTLLAAAVAEEVGCAFIPVSGSGFVECLVGRGAARVRDLFREARRKAPCIVFIDEIDAVAKSRGGFSLNDEREQTLNQLLCELDGFNHKDDDATGEDPHDHETRPVVLICATNRPECLDTAITRPGRLDKIVHVPLPDARGRLAILHLHARRLNLHPDVDLEPISEDCDNYSGADVANVANEAALLALRDGLDHVTQRHLLLAVAKREAARDITGPNATGLGGLR